jgi:hypothetical protein
VVKSTGDGHLATFDGPTQAIRCAEALRADAETLGIEIRAGIHTGECELLDTDIGGLAVHIAARILGQACAGEILVSRTVRDLVVGSGTGLEDRGSVELRGVPGTWQLLAVDRPPPDHPQTTDRGAPLGPRRSGNGQAHTVDPARDGPPHPGNSELSGYGVSCRLAFAGAYHALHHRVCQALLLESDAAGVRHGCADIAGHDGGA